MINDEDKKRIKEAQQNALDRARAGDKKTNEIHDTRDALREQRKRAVKMLENKITRLLDRDLKDIKDVASLYHGNGSLQSMVRPTTGIKVSRLGKDVARLIFEILDNGEIQVSQWTAGEPNMVNTTLAQYKPEDLSDDIISKHAADFVVALYDRNLISP